VAHGACGAFRHAHQVLSRSGWQVGGQLRQAAIDEGGAAGRRHGTLWCHGAVAAGSDSLHEMLQLGLCCRGRTVGPAFEVMARTVRDSGTDTGRTSCAGALQPALRALVLETVSRMEMRSHAGGFVAYAGAQLSRCHQFKPLNASRWLHRTAGMCSTFSLAGRDFTSDLPTNTLRLRLLGRPRHRAALHRVV
jgi:hypothetical protein